MRVSEPCRSGHQEWRRRRRHGRARPPRRRAGSRAPAASWVVREVGPRAQRSMTTSRIGREQHTSTLPSARRDQGLRRMDQQEMPVEPVDALRAAIEAASVIASSHSSRSAADINAALISHGARVLCAVHDEGIPGYLRHAADACTGHGAGRQAHRGRGGGRSGPVADGVARRRAA